MTTLDDNQAATVEAARKHHDDLERAPVVDDDMWTVEMCEAHADRGALLAIVADLARRLGEAERQTEPLDIRGGVRR